MARRGWIRAVTVVALALALVVAATPLTAVAGTATSNYSYFTCGAYGYRNRASVTTDASGARATTMVYSNPSVNRPTGWYGSYSRLYNDQHALIAYSGYYYNSGPALGFGHTSPAAKVKDSYYSYGITKSWNGRGYDAHATWKSPLQTY